MYSAKIAGKTKKCVLLPTKQKNGQIKKVCQIPCLYDMKTTLSLAFTRFGSPHYITTTFSFSVKIYENPRGKFRNRIIPMGTDIVKIRLKNTDSLSFLTSFIKWKFLREEGWISQDALQ